MTALEISAATEAADPILHRHFHLLHLCHFTVHAYATVHCAKCNEITDYQLFPLKEWDPFTSQTFSFLAFPFTVEKDRRQPVLPHTYKYSEILLLEYTVFHEHNGNVHIYM